MLEKDEKKKGKLKHKEIVAHAEKKKYNKIIRI